MLKKKRLEIIRKHYPNALTTIDSINKMIIPNIFEMMREDLGYLDKLRPTGIKTQKPPFKMAFVIYIRKIII